MTRTVENRPMIRFSTPDPQTNKIEVMRILPDGSEEQIGQIFPDFNEEGEIVNYVTFNTAGEEVLQPTSDFNQIEIFYQKSAKDNTERLIEENVEMMMKEYDNHKNELKSIRVRQSRLSTKNTRLITI